MPVETVLSLSGLSQWLLNLTAELAEARLQPLPIKAGAIVMLSEGEYDDYRVESIVRALADIDLNALAQQFMPTTSPDHTSDLPFRDAEAFANWLVNNGHVERVTYEEVRVEQFGGWDVE
jgi:hypothetical protein